jgi:hypothetical protein
MADIVEDLKTAAALKHAALDHIIASEWVTREEQAIAEIQSLREQLKTARRDALIEAMNACDEERVVPDTDDPDPTDISYNNGVCDCYDAIRALIGEGG